MKQKQSYAENFQINQEHNEGKTITIDGFAATGKGTAAAQLSEMLGIKSFSASDIFYEIADERGLSEEQLSEQAEEEVDRAIDRRTVKKSFSKPSVVDSRISSWVLGDYSDLRIRLKASKEERINRVAERDNPDNPRQKITRRDEGDRERYRKYYGISMSDMSIYHVVIDNTNMSLDQQKRMLKTVAETYL
jgi:cytidylate kinase